MLALKHRSCFWNYITSETARNTFLTYITYMHNNNIHPSVHPYVYGLFLTQLHKNTSSIQGHLKNPIWFCKAKIQLVLFNWSKIQHIYWRRKLILKQREILLHSAMTLPHTQKTQQGNSCRDSIWWNGQIVYSVESACKKIRLVWE